LLRHFGSVRAVRAATLEELRQVPGIPPALAEQIYAILHEAPPSEAAARTP
jgi:excinuclease ABC subunit C